MFDNVYPRPIWRITLAGEDFAKRIQPRLMELTITDNRGLSADELDFSLEDTDGKLVIPPRGALIQVALGWQHTGLVDKGSYLVDEIEHSGAPDQLTIRARSADLRESMGEKKERDWHEQTLGEIVTEIAGEHGLQPVISPELAGEMVDHIDQTDEADASFLTRLAERHDAMATVKSGKLLFYKIGRGATAISGTPLKTARITRKDGDKHRFSFADRETAGAVRACYYDTGLGEKVSVRVDGERHGKSRVDETTVRVKTLRHTYANEADAQRAAAAEIARIQRGMATFFLTLAYGRPELIPDLPAQVDGWNKEIDAVDWLITKVEHRLSNSGYTTDVEMEIRLEGGDVEEEEVDED
jgi:phage protein D